MKRSIPLEHGSDGICEIWSLPGLVPFFRFDCTPTHLPIENETQGHVPNVRISCRLGFDSNTESQNSWEKLQVPAPLLQGLSPEVIPAAKPRSNEWQVRDSNSGSFVPSIPAHTLFPWHSSALLFLRLSDPQGISPVLWWLYSILLPPDFSPKINKRGIF